VKDERQRVKRMRKLTVRHLLLTANTNPLCRKQSTSNPKHKWNTTTARCTHPPLLINEYRSHTIWIVINITWNVEDTPRSVVRISGAKVNDAHM
jgi:hypothetical protein